MRRWFLLSRVSDGQNDSWIGQYAGENGILATTLFVQSACIQDKGSVFLIKLCPWRGNLDLILWRDRQHTPIADDAWEPMAASAVDTLMSSGVVCPSGWSRPQNWIDAFADYHIWLKVKGCVQP